mmetsp:Transcript_50256/g.120412  ORF Transcript_50256/g.120412 Transcript_50256/m.120412 type:complete len:210 (-) Transcript_50256:97-726(-)
MRRRGNFRNVPRKPCPRHHRLRQTLNKRRLTQVVRGQPQPQLQQPQRMVAGASVLPPLSLWRNLNSMPRASMHSKHLLGTYQGLGGEAPTWAKRCFPPLHRAVHQWAGGREEGRGLWEAAGSERTRMMTWIPATLPSTRTLREASGRKGWTLALVRWQQTRPRVVRCSSRAPCRRPERSSERRGVGRSRLAMTMMIFGSWPDRERARAR